MADYLARYSATGLMISCGRPVPVSSEYEHRFTAEDNKKARYLAMQHLAVLRDGFREDAEHTSSDLVGLLRVEQVDSV